MKYITLNNKEKTKLDDEDYIKFGLYKWTSSKDKSGDTRQVRRINLGYKKSKMVQLHRVIMKAKKGQIVDHINRDTLDNRKINLRICNKSQNGMNRPANKNSKSGIKGVSWCVRDNRWTAHISKKIDGKYKQKSLGNFKIKEEAASAYNKAAKELFGEFAFINKL